MAGKNTFQTLQPQQQSAEKPKRFSDWLHKVENKNSIVSMIGDTNEAAKFISSISSAVATKPALQDCAFPTIISAGLLANALKLSMSPSIGHCYILPFNDNKNDRIVATFVLGYKGYIQLALRSGYYEQLNVVEIKEGEVIEADDINEVYKFKRIKDDKERASKPTVGYYAYFRYNAAHGGFFKAMYWAKDIMLQYADTYAPAFNLDAVKSNNPKKSRVSYADFLAHKYPPEDAWKYSSFWYVNFDSMAKKTMIRQLIGKWGIMSVDFQKAYEADGSYKDELSPDAPIYYSGESSDNDDTMGNTVMVGGEPDDEEIARLAEMSGVDDEEDKEIIADEDGVVQSVSENQKTSKKTTKKGSVEEAFFQNGVKK